jgi:hypothetical protein
MLYERFVYDGLYDYGEYDMYRVPSKYTYDQIMDKVYRKVKWTGPRQPLQNHADYW